MQIALGVVVAFGLLYFVALRPKSDSGAVTPAPAPTAQETATTQAGGTGLLSRPDEARRAADEAERAGGRNSDAPAQAQSRPGADSQARPEPGSQSAPQERASTDGSARRDLSAPILSAARRGRVQVVLFYSADGTDDRFVRSQLRAIDRRGGNVAVREIPLSRIGRYRTLADAASVNSAPTIVVLGRRLTARTISGYTDTGEINGLVGAVARRN